VEVGHELLDGRQGYGIGFVDEVHWAGTLAGLGAQATEPAYDPRVPRAVLPIVLAVTAIAGPARADRDRALAVGAAIVPGVVVHGSGHWVAEDRAMARRLALAELIGLGMIALGALPVGITGGAPETLPGLAIAIPGAGLFLTSWFADIYGAAGGARLDGRSRTAPALVEVEAGYLVVTDARAGATHAGAFAASAWLDRGHVAITGWVGADARELGGEVGVRVLGGVRGRPARDGSAVELAIAGYDRRFDDDGLRATVLAIAARGRYELARVGPSLAGSFATLEVGVGHERLHFDAGVDAASLLLARFGWGVELGDDAEVELFYDHRRDALAGRLVLDAGANGFAGHVGVEGAAFRGRWGVTGSIEAGAHWVARLAVAARLP